MIANKLSSFDSNLLNNDKTFSLLNYKMSGISNDGLLQLLKRRLIENELLKNKPLIPLEEYSEIVDVSQILEINKF